MYGMQVTNRSMPRNCGMQGMHENTRVNPKAKRQVEVKMQQKESQIEMAKGTFENKIDIKI